MRFFSGLALVAWGAAVVPSPVTAADARQAAPVSPPAAVEPMAPTAPPLQELVALALERSPALSALSEKLAAAREMVAPAGALPDPMIELMLQDVAFPRYTVGSQEMSMIGPEVSQRLPFPGKRAARRAAARAEVAVRFGELVQLRRQLVADVRGLYARIYALDGERSTLTAGRQLLDMLAATATMRYSVGKTEKEAVIKVQLETSRLEERSDDADAERKTLVAALDRLLDRPVATPIGHVAQLPPAAVPARPWQDAVLAASAEVAVRRAALAAAERRVELARLDLKPDFSAGAAVGLRGAFDPVATLRFGVELPLWAGAKQRPMILAAEHEREMAKAEVRDAEATARSEAARLEAEWDRAEKQIVRYRQGIIPQSSAAVDAARGSYLSGQGDFLTVVEDFRMWLDARTELARREADRFTTWAQLDALITDQGPDAGAQAQGSAPAPEPSALPGHSAEQSRATMERRSDHSPSLRSEVK